MFRPYMWAIFRLRSNFFEAAILDVWGVFWILGLGGGGGEISPLPHPTPVYGSVDVFSSRIS